MDLARFNCRVTRLHHRVAVLEVTSPNHQEFFSVSEGDRTLAVTVLDVTNAMYSEPRSYSIEKPSGWRTDVQAEELLLAIWKTVLPT